MSPLHASTDYGLGTERGGGASLSASYLAASSFKPPKWCSRSPSVYVCALAPSASTGCKRARSSARERFVTSSEIEKWYGAAAAVLLRHDMANCVQRRSMLSVGL